MRQNHPLLPKRLSEFVDICNICTSKHYKCPCALPPTEYPEPKTRKE